MTRARAFFEFLFGPIHSPWSWLFVVFVAAIFVLDHTGHQGAGWVILGLEFATIAVLRFTRDGKGDRD